MSFKYTLALLVATALIQPAFADDDDDKSPDHNKSCAAIVKSCMDAGYTRKGSDGKQFWKDCMKPLVMGKTVSGVTVDANDVKTCRDTKIKALEQQLEQLKEVH